MAVFKALADRMRAAWFPDRPRLPPAAVVSPARPPATAMRLSYTWQMIGCDVSVTAPTKSEARAKLKQALGLRRLPAGVRIVRI